MPAMTVSEVKLQSDLMSAEQAQLLLPKLTDEQLATLKPYGTTEKTSIGQVLATAGDLTYDLMVVLERRGRGVPTFTTDAVAPSSSTGRVSSSPSWTS